MKIIGLTGGIGSGKSTAAQFLAELGAEVIDLDEAGHEVLKKGGAVYKKVVREFGEGILDYDGEIDRTRLGRIVFKDRQALKRLNNIVYPAIDKIVENKVNESRRKGIQVVILEAAIMLEAEKTWQVDEVWLTKSNKKTVLQRLKERPGYTEAEVKRRIKSQMTNKERIKQADVVINNDGTLEELKVKVKLEWEKLLKRTFDC
jgi:dephospho-CoA kinase